MDRSKSDRILSAAVATTFSFALSSLTLIVPLLAIHAGYSMTYVGLLVGLAAVTQIAARLGMGAVLRRVADKTLLSASAVLIALSCFLLATSAALAVFVLAQLVQGVARSLFWTSGQAHAVRANESSVRGLRNMNVAAGVGALCGPVIAGLVWELSPSVALIVAGSTGVLALIPSLFLIKFPTFHRSASGENEVQRIWTQPGVRAGCGMNVAAGAWRSIMDSYVPVVLSGAGLSGSLIGLLITLGNGAMLGGSSVSSWLREKGTRVSLIVGLLCSGLGIALVAPSAGAPIVVGAVIGLSGLGAGVMQTVGPAIASDAVHPERRGDALVLTGTSRAVALFATPFMFSGALSVLPVGVVLGSSGVLIALPAALVAASRWRR